uniref:Uncharacterized protein n=1 Tax=Mus spicilegus TaxID=10103 RepID=A0A8C6GHJ7_MUSSI
MDKIKLANITAMDKARDLCDHVSKKGPQASQIFITYICNEDCYLAGILELQSAPSAETFVATEDSKGGHPSSSETKEEQNKEDGTFPGLTGTLKFCPLEKAQKLWKENPSEIYPIMNTTTRTRLALIICNTEFQHLSRRVGAQVDLREMKLLLEDLGYTVKVKENLTALEMVKEVKEFAACPEHKTSDSTFLVFMSHGIQEGICGTTYSNEVSDILKVDTIFQMMNTLKCPSLKDKPKVIIIQACRGEKQGVVLLKDSVRDSEEDFLTDAIFEDDGIKKAHIEKDFIAFCSSTPENKHPDKPLKVLEQLGKEVLTEYLEKLVQSNVLKLKEEDKQKFNNAERSDKRWVFVDAMKKKHSKVGEMLLQTFFSVDPGSHHGEANLEMEEPEESLNTLKLCSPEEFTRLCREKTQEGMESEMKDFAALSEHQTSDSTFLVLMSHGTLHGICGTMHSEKTPDVLQYDTIYQIFNNCHCPGLRDKPKVIIVQACRGGNSGEMWIRESSKPQLCRGVDLPRNMEADAVKLSHVEKDFIAFYSTTPHHLSYRDKTGGSYFITRLISCFRKHACSCHLFDIFLKVQQSFEKASIHSQMPTIDRATLTRYFYLFPGN